MSRLEERVNRAPETAGVGLLLVAGAVLLGSLFFLDNYHDFYWSHPAVFIILTLTGVSCALAGGILLGKSLHSAWHQDGSRALPITCTGIGIVSAAAGTMAGVVAIGLAAGVSSTGYWGHPVHSYDGDYTIMGWQILTFQLSVLLETLGGFFVALGLSARWRRPGIHWTDRNAP